MSHVSRMALGLKGTVATAFLSLLWVWLQPYLAAVVEEFPGPFTSSWNFIETVVPITIGVFYVIFIGYVLWGPIEKERARRIARGPR